MCAVPSEQVSPSTPSYFKNYVHRAVELELLDPRLAQYDLERLGQAMDANRDLQFTYLGLQ